LRVNTVFKYLIDLISFITHRFSLTLSMAITTLTTRQVQQYAAVLTRYPLFEPVDDDEEWDYG
jgi:hypothetical protein